MVGSPCWERSAYQVGRAISSMPTFFKLTPQLCWKCSGLSAHAYSSVFRCRDSSKSTKTKGSLEPFDRLRVRSTTTAAALAVSPTRADNTRTIRGEDIAGFSWSSDGNFFMKVCPRGASELGSSHVAEGGPEIAAWAGNGIAPLLARRQRPGNMTVKCLHPLVSLHLCWQAKTTWSRWPVMYVDGTMSGDQVSPICMQRKRPGKNV